MPESLSGVSTSILVNIMFCSYKNAALMSAVMSYTSIHINSVVLVKQKIGGFQMVNRLSVLYKVASEWNTQSGCDECDLFRILYN